MNFFKIKNVWFLYHNKLIITWTHAISRPIIQTSWSDILFLKIKIIQIRQGCNLSSCLLFDLITRQCGLWWTAFWIGLGSTELGSSLGSISCFLKINLCTMGSGSLDWVPLFGPVKTSTWNSMATQQGPLCPYSFYIRAGTFSLHSFT